MSIFFGILSQITINRRFSMKTSNNSIEIGGWIEDRDLNKFLTDGKARQKSDLLCLKQLDGSLASTHITDTYHLLLYIAWWG